jgi:hypothetical protein
LISLCVPSRGRPDMLLRLFRSAAATAGNGKFELCCWLDEDDRHADRYPQRQRIKYGNGPRPVDSDGILKTSGLWTKAASLASGDILGLIGDDSTIDTPGWAEAIEAEFAKVPDRILMVYPEDGTGRHRPETLFISREWLETTGEFTPEGYPGWMADNWIWTIAAEIRRVSFLSDVTIKHHQGSIKDPTLRDGREARDLMGGLRGIQAKFWSPTEKSKRDDQVSRIRSVMSDSVPDMMPCPEPGWSIKARAGGSSDTLVVVHCYEGDKHVVEDKLPYYKRHGHPVLVLSPEDSPVSIPGVECRSGGKRGYVGQDSLDREMIHLSMLLDTPYQWFFLNDADSLCIYRDLPEYLYDDSGVFWSNIAVEHRDHPSPYPKVGLHPPYFAHRSVIEKMVAHGSMEAHPITPFIDWLLIALISENNIPYRAYPNGVSFPAWKHGRFPDTINMGNDYNHLNGDGEIDGQAKMVKRVLRGADMLHSIKHLEVLKDVSRAHERYVKKKRR